MTTSTTDFFSRSRQIVESFLQTVVIVDDRLVMPTTAIEPTALVEPSDIPSDIIESEREGGETATPAPPADTAQHTTRFDAKPIVDGFARKGIACCVLQPSRDQIPTLGTILSQIAKTADIVVVDWSMHGDHGEEALELVKRLALIGAESAAQPLLVAIYTIDPGLPTIPGQIKDVLLNGGVSDVKLENTGYDLTTQYARFSVFAKPESVIPEECASRVVAFEDLADRLIDEFTKITAGLVSNCVLESLAQVRLNTHKMLNTFSSELDAPYLTHRALLKTPQEAEEFLVCLLAAELQSILEQARVGDTVNIDAIRAWILQEAQVEPFKMAVNAGFREWTPEELVARLTEGIDTVDHSKCGISKNKFHKHPLTQMLDHNQSRSRLLNDRFAQIATLRTYHRERPRILTLGTVLELLGAASALFYVCVQPRCDCMIRGDGIRGFPFLPLKMTSSAEDMFELVLGKEPDFKRFAIERKPHLVEMIMFKRDSSTSPVVTASDASGEYRFQDTLGREYRWIGELRLPHGLRLSNEFAGQISRVGTDNFEWLRRWARESE